MASSNNGYMVTSFACTRSSKQFRLDVRLADNPPFRTLASLRTLSSYQVAWASRSTYTDSTIRIGRKLIKQVLTAALIEVFSKPNSLKSLSEFSVTSASTTSSDSPINLTASSTKSLAYSVVSA